MYICIFYLSTYCILLTCSGRSVVLKFPSVKVKSASLHLTASVTRRLRPNVRVKMLLQLMKCFHYSHLLVFAVSDEGIEDESCDGK